MPVTTVSLTTSGAPVMVSAMPGSATWASQIRLPSVLFSARIRPSMTGEITMLPCSATPRLLMPQQSTLGAQSLSGSGSDRHTVTGLPPRTSSLDTTPQPVVR